MSHVKFLMEHAAELVPILYDHARTLAKRKYRWREGKSLPMGKTPEDIVSEVFVSYIKGEGSEGRRVAGARHFDPDKDILLQLKGAIRSAMWALSDRSSAKNEHLDESCEGESDEKRGADFAPNESTPAERAESIDFASVAVEKVKSRVRAMKSKDMENLFAAFEMEIYGVEDQCRELGKNANEIAQLRFQLRQLYLEVVEELNNEVER